MKRLNLIFFILLMFSASVIVRSQTGGGGSISGQVTDSDGAVIAGAKVTVIDAAAKEKSAVTGKDGEFTIGGLPPGIYTVRAAAAKFGAYEQTAVEIKSGAVAEKLTIALTIEAIKEEVQVNGDNTVTTESDGNLSATVLKGQDLEEMLPDDPDDLEAYLQALAGPGAGPNGGQIYIDGFSGGRIPPKEAIREIRINSNPFSAEYDKMGLSRIEILTKPGSDKFRGSLGLNFNSADFNSRNPFALNRAPAQTRNLSGYLSGPLKKKKASFFLDVSQNEQDRSSIVTATVLDPAFNIVSLNQDYKIPSRRISFSPRIDYELSPENTLVARYSYTHSSSENQGVNGFSLLSRAYDSSDTQHTLQLTESAILSARTVNETRFQFESNRRDQNGDNSIPTINVSASFTGGGAQIGKSFNRTSRWELQNYTTTSFGANFQHAVKFGVRVRGIKIQDHSENGYGGSFNFAGVRDPVTGEVLYSSIEQYRQKVLGNPNPIFNPNQFSLTSGNPDAAVSQIDYAPFITDDWRARRNITLSLGLRYENQNNLHDNGDLAPRIGIAWAPFAKDKKPSKTVLRGAFGIFYDRFSESSTLQARRNDGVSQLRYIVSDSTILGQAVFTNGGVKNAPTAAQLKSGVPLSSTPFRIAGELKAPRSLQTVFSIEHSLPLRSGITATFYASNNLNTLRQRNINAPVCPNTQICPAVLTFQQILPLRPDPLNGNIYQLESTGKTTTRQLLLRFNTRLNTHISMFANYTLSDAHSTADGNGFPAYSYDLKGEEAPSSFTARHYLNASGSIGLPFQIRISPTVIFSTGRRFNIVTGSDTNHDSVYTERPTYAVLHERCVDLKLTNDFCNISGIQNTNAVIPRNYAVGPGNFVVNLNLNKSFGIGAVSATPAPSGRRGGGGGGGGGRGNGGNGGGGGRIGAGSNRAGAGTSATSTATAASDKPSSPNWFNKLYANDKRRAYNLSVGVSVQNLFNTVNLTAPQGNLSSPFFGRSISTGGNFGGYGSAGSYNRRVDLTLRFSF